MLTIEEIMERQRNLDILLGNAPEYDVATNEISNEASSYPNLKGKRIIFLGSSVTYGFGGLGTSFVDYLVAEEGVVATKEAINGTTLVTEDEKSYFPRLEALKITDKPDLLLTQLSTNDAMKKYDIKDIEAAIRKIVAYGQDVLGCPVAFYTGSRYESPEYKAMVEMLFAIKDEIGISIIDLWHDDELNDISDELYELYMVDPVHPTKAGYRDWWGPAIKCALNEILA